ncbi:MAG: LysE family translocator [Siculibacillus sp.]
MTLTALLAFAGALFLNAGSPGPSVAALVAQVLTRGARSVLPFLAAMWIGEAAWLGAAVAGLSVLAERMHEVFVVVKWAGIAYLAWLAVGMWRGAAAGAAEDAAPEATAPLRLFATGLALTIGNPKVMVFYVALLPSLIDVRALDLADWAVLTAVQVAVMATVDLGWTAAAARARRLFRSPRALFFTRRASAVAMGGAAAAIAAKG